MRSIKKHAIAAMKWIEKYHKVCNSGNEMRNIMNRKIVAIKYIMKHARAVMN